MSLFSWMVVEDRVRECVMRGVQLSAPAMAKWLVLERIVELAQLRLS